MSSEAEEQDIFFEILKLSVFLGALWASGFLCRQIKISSIVGQLAVGILLGPDGVDFVPLFQGNIRLNATILELADIDIDEPSESENFLVVLGQLGVALLIVESGMHVDFRALQEVGFQALFVAVLGTALPMVLGILLSEVLGFGHFPIGLALGAVMAPTSVGIALKLLQEAHVLDSKFGQTIVAAAFLDDILSLVTLTILLELAAGDLTAWVVLKPIIFSSLFILITFAMAIYTAPRIITPLLELINKKASIYLGDICHMALVFLTLALYGFIGHLIGSHLLGAFVTGVTFSKVPRSQIIWKRELSIIIEWLTALFFGATVAFAIPVDQILAAKAFTQGVLICAVAGILGKLAAGLPLHRRWIIGWAMVGRGEFAFLVAQTLKETTFESRKELFLSEEAFAAAIWALLLATLIAPIAFGFALASNVIPGRAKRKVEKEALDEKESKRGRDRWKEFFDDWTQFMRGTTRKNAPMSEWNITVKSSHQNDLLKDCVEVFKKHDIGIRKFKSHATHGKVIYEFTVVLPDVLSELVHVDHLGKESTLLIDAHEFGQAKHLAPEKGPGTVRQRQDYKDSFLHVQTELLAARLKDNLEALVRGEVDVSLQQNKHAGHKLHIKYLTKEAHSKVEDKQASSSQPTVS